MICFVDIEHPSALHDPDRRDSLLSYLMDAKLRLEEISGLPCIVQLFADVTRQRLRDLGISHLAISGNAADWADYDEGAFVEMHHIVREAEWPIIGFCGGAQLIAIAHDAPLGPMRRLRPDEAEITTLSAPGYSEEWDFITIRVIDSDPLLCGIPYDGVGQSPNREVGPWQTVGLCSPCCLSCEPRWGSSINPLDRFLPFS